MKSRNLTALVLALVLAATCAARPPVRYRMLYGLEPRWLGGDQLLVQLGSCADVSGTVEMSVTPATHGRGIVLDVRTMGLGGRDAGAVVDGWWYVYMLHNETTGVTGAVLTISPSYSGVARPPGFDRMRKLPFAVYREAGRFRRYRILSWPRAHIDYTEFETSAKFAALIGGGATGWSLFHLARLVPPNADTANLSFFAANLQGESAKSAYVRSVDSRGGGILVATVSPLQGFDTGGYLPLTMDSLQQAYYMWNAPGGFLTVMVKGFYISEAN